MEPPDDLTSPAADDLTFQHYRVLRREDGSPWRLGAGGMGATYKAKDTNLDSLVALKVIRGELLNRDPFARERFVREAKAAASLRHPHVATVYHLGNDGGSYFYAMEFIAGETVEDRVRRLGPFAAPAALALMLQAARALAAAHRLGLIHRDIKPANLMLVDVNEDEGEGTALKLIDFGLAKSVAAGAGPGHDVSQNSTPVFTPAYASPEQCQELPADIRGDIYSLGVTLWFMLTGAPTFRARSTFELQSKHIHAPLPLEELEAAGVLAPVRELLARMLEKDPADRPQTPADLRREIEACQRALTQATGGQENAAPAPPYAFSLEDLLRRRGQLPWAEARALLAPLAAIADDLAASGPEALAHFAARRLHAVFPSFRPAGPEKENSRPDASLERPADWPTRWPDFQLLSRTAGDTAPHRPAEDFGVTQPPAPPQYRDAAQALAALIYELVSGHAPDLRSAGGAPRPLTGINEEGNALLRRALLGGIPGFDGGAKDLRAALERAADASIPPLPKPDPTPQPKPDPQPVPPQPFLRAAGFALALLFGGGLLLYFFAGQRPKLDLGDFSPSPPPSSPSPSPVWPSPAPSANLKSLSELFAKRTPTPVPSLDFSKLFAATPTPASKIDLSKLFAVTPTPKPADFSKLLARTLTVPGDYQTIQAAIDAAQPGDTVRVRAGQYTESLAFKAGINLVGEGMERTIVRCPAAKGDVLAVRGCPSGWISDLGFEHTDQDKTKDSYDGVWLNGSAVQLRRCQVRFAKGQGIECDKKDRSLVQDCAASRCGGSGIKVTDAETAPTLVNNALRENVWAGITFQSAAAGRAEANVCENNGTFGVAVFHAGTDPMLVNNQARANKLSGIMFQGGASGQADGNLCEGNSESGIAVIGQGTAPTLFYNRATQNTLAGITFQEGGGGEANGNVCNGNATSGIAAFSGAAPRLRANHCEANNNYGIYVNADAAPLLANDNALLGNKGGARNRPTP